MSGRCFSIGLEDLAGNAFAIVLRDDPSRRFLSYDVLERYGAEVANSLMRTGDRANLLLSRDRTRQVLWEYEGFFEEEERDGLRGVSVKPNIGADELIMAFRGYLAVDLLLALSDVKAVSALGVSL